MNKSKLALVLLGIISIVLAVFSAWFALSGSVKGSLRTFEPETFKPTVKPTSNRFEPETFKPVVKPTSNRFEPESF